MQDDELTLIASGDMMFDRRTRPPRIIFHQSAFSSASSNFRASRPTPFLNTVASRDWLKDNGIPLDGILCSSHSDQSLSLDLAPEADSPEFPFDSIAPELRSADLVFANLECPLSTRGRPTRNEMCYRADPRYALAMVKAGISVVSFSNNHCMDYGDVAFEDTVAALKAAGITPIGVVGSSHDRQRAAALEVRGMCIGFLGYNLLGPDETYAGEQESGIIPLNPLTLAQDCANFTEQIDLSVASVHWGDEQSLTPTQQMIDLGHLCVDSGVDIVLGHHSHVPGAIEIYKGKPIVYSLGNFIFGHTHEHWTTCNMLVKFTCAQKSVTRIEIVPIGSLNAEVFQPCLVGHDRAHILLSWVSEASAKFGTKILPVDGHGIVDIPQHHRNRSARLSDEEAFPAIGWH